MANLENDAKWRREFVETRKTSEGPIGIGTRFSLFGEFLGRRIETVYQTTAYEPNHVAAWETVSGPLPLTFQRTFERVEGGTQVTIIYEVEIRGFLKLIKPLVISAGKRAQKGDLPKVKEMMEAHAL
jgi:hypothetical protein